MNIPVQFIINVVYVQLFWLSFVVIGYGAWRLFEHKADRWFSLKKLATFMDNTHIIARFLLYLSLGMAVFAPLLVIAVILKLPVFLYAAFYLLALAASLIMILLNRKNIFASIKNSLPNRPTKLVVLCTLVIVGIFAADYVISLKLGPPLFGDAIVHNAKIQQMSHGNFTLIDPIFGNGVVESRYHINLPLSIFSLAVQLLRIDAITLWVYSLAFWRLVTWLALFSLAWVFLDKTKVQKRWSYAILAMSPLFYSATFFFATYPGRIVYIWTIVFLIGLKLLYDQKSIWLLLMGSVLIALTHPINSVAAATFLGLFIIAGLILKLLNKPQLKILGLAVAILLLPAIFSTAFPNRMTEVAAGLEPILIRRHGPILLGLPAKWHGAWDPWLVVILSTIGYLYLIVKSNARVQKVMIGLLVIFYGLVVYNPVLLEVVRGNLPAWVVSRFSELNMFGFTAPAIGLLFIVEYLSKKISKKVSLNGVTIAVVIVVGLYSVVGLKTVKSFMSFHAEYTRNYNGIMLLKEFKSDLNNQIAFADNTLTQQWLPSIANVNIINVNETHASPMANMDIRWPCSVKLREELNYQDLRAARITRVIANPEIDPLIDRLAASHPDLILIRQSGANKLYGVRSDGPSFAASTEASICNIPFGQ